MERDIKILITVNTDYLTNGDGINRRRIGMIDNAKAIYSTKKIHT